MNTNRLTIKISIPHKFLNAVILSLLISFPVFSQILQSENSSLLAKNNGVDSKVSEITFPKDSTQESNKGINTDSIKAVAEVSKITLSPINDLSPKNSFDFDSLVNFAKQYLGTPYRLAGRSSKGFDCSGFVHHVYKNFNVKVPYSCPAISSVCVKKIDKIELKKGDLLFFKGSNIKSKAIGHIAIVYEVDDKGNIHMIHSCRRGVILEKFNESKYYKARYLFAKRIL